MSERDPLQIVGQTIAEKYAIEALVGEGGFAVVYRATAHDLEQAGRDQVLQRPVARRRSTSATSSQQRLHPGGRAAHRAQQPDARASCRRATSAPTPRPTANGCRTWCSSGSRARARRAARPRASAGRRRPGRWSRARGCSRQVRSGARRRARQGHRPSRHQAGQPLRARRRAHRQRHVKVLDFGVAKMMSDNTQLKAALAKTGMNVTSLHAAVRRARAVQPQLRRDRAVDGRVRAGAGRRGDAERARPRSTATTSCSSRFASGNPGQAAHAAHARRRACRTRSEQVFAKALAVQPRGPLRASAASSADALELRLGWARRRHD